jgi:glycosyltransferase involved in cell wall biosynthesis
MKVLICGSSQGEYGGIEAVMFAKAEYLSKQPSVSCTLAFKLVKGHQLKASLDEWISSTDVPVKVLTRMDVNLITLIKANDVVHTQNVPPDIVFLCKLIGKPIISLTHNFRQPRFSPHNFIWKFGNLICDYITYNSSFVSKTWNRNYIRNRNSKVVPALSQLPESRPPGGKRKGFVFISRWIDNKGADLLIEAYSKANIDKHSWPLIMMGGGPLREPLQKKVEADNLEGISILGRVSEEEKNNQIASAKWIVVPPNTHEDMGLTPIEGRQLGTPAIASLDGGIPESAGNHALFFEPGNIEELRSTLEKSTKIEECHYLEIAEKSQRSLSTYLYPLSVYEAIYRRVLCCNEWGQAAV